MKFTAFSWLNTLVVAALVGCSPAQSSHPDESAEISRYCQLRSSFVVDGCLGSAEMVRRDTHLRLFALRECPTLWELILKLRAETDVLATNICRLEEELRAFGRGVEFDKDVADLRDRMREIIKVHDQIYAKLSDAYIASAKYEASPSRKEYELLKRNSLQDGLAEAQLATQKFNSLRMSR